MKRGALDVKHQTLLQEYLELQKEFVLKKKKLESAKEKRDTLFAEVRFLRRRQKYLLKAQSPRPELDTDVVCPPNSALDRKIMERERNHSSYGVALKNHYPVLVSNSNLIDKEKWEAEEKQVLRGKGILRKMFKGKRKPSESSFTDDKRASKKKISWQDPLNLKV